MNSFLMRRISNSHHPAPNWTDDYIRRIFCHDILKLAIPCAKATANLVVALASYMATRSLVELRLSPTYQYQFSSVFKALAHLAVNLKGHRELAENIQRMCAAERLFFTWAIKDQLINHNQLKRAPPAITAAIPRPKSAKPPAPGCTARSRRPGAIAAPGCGRR